MARLTWRLTNSVWTGGRTLVRYGHDAPHLILHSIPSKDNEFLSGESEKEILSIFCDYNFDIPENDRWLVSVNGHFIPRESLNDAVNTAIKLACTEIQEIRRQEAAIRKSVEPFLPAFEQLRKLYIAELGRRPAAGRVTPREMEAFWEDRARPPRRR